jgi:acetyl-CoA carboxylase carboxyl transferase alpha subunit/acetyl-CoA carboxylase carboxyl transferase beta subunit
MPIKLPSFRPRRDAYPADLWTKCPSCGEMLFNRQLQKSLRVCPNCGHHFRMTAAERLALLLDPGSFEERDANLQSVDPLGFVDQKPYPERLGAAQLATGLRDAAVWGFGRIAGERIAICVMDFGFMGGSMGSVVGEKVARAAEAALAERVPLVIVSASGGARMQEGTLALMQLAKTLAAIERLRAARIPYVSILTDPTTGGVYASFAAVGDVNLAEPNALIGFAGARVSAGTIAAELPAGFQRAEFLFRHGFVDRVVPRAALRDELALVLRYLRPPKLAVAGPDEDGEAALPAFRPLSFISELADRVLAEARRDEAASGTNVEPGVTADRSTTAERGTTADRSTTAERGAASAAAATPRTASAAAAAPGNAETAALPPDQAAVWERVQLARHLRRPRTLELVGQLADEWLELHGDRLFGDDEAIVAGLARIDGRRLVVVGHQKGAETEENIRRNFGMPHPEGYRKAIRCFELAERFGLPVLTIVDTPGAYPGPAAEERGVAEAIARAIASMTRLRTPIVTVIAGEGGSGGALAIAAGDVVLALENAVYSVISPEGCASILWRTAERAPEAAVAMRMTAADQLALGVVDAVVEEPPGGAHLDHAETARRLRPVVLRHLDALASLPVEELVERRYRRYRAMGAFTEVAAEAVVPGRPSLADRIRGLLDAGRQSIVSPGRVLPGRPGGGRPDDEVRR